jgi:putative addiction module antidote
VTAIGNSAGIILSKELLEILRVGKGDVLYVHETKNGIELSRYDSEFAAQMAIAKKVMQEDRDVLRVLAE